MTCIAGIIEGSDVWIGADTESTWGYTKCRFGSKVFTVGDAVMAWTGRSCIPAALKHRLSPPDVSEGKGDHWLYVTLPDAIRATLKGLDLMEGGEVRGGGALIVGWRGRLVQMDDSLAAFPSADGFVAHGSGGEVAIGAMQVLADRPPEERLRRAIEAAQKWSVGVGGEVHVVKVGGGGEGDGGCGGLAL